jgi:polar amino acid transport system substrate-binding protein
VADKFGFRSFSTDAAEVFSRKDVNAVFIATRHKTHADLVVAALAAGKSVFVEKPLAIIEEDLKRISDALGARSDARIMVGFNRRFAPLARHARDFFRGHTGPFVINYRVNAGFIPRDHWTQTDEGGGRILGEVCHFVDLLQYVTGAKPKTVFAECVFGSSDKAVNQDNVAITIRFNDGSVGVISYLACGDRLLSKERVEIFGGGRTFIIDDFQSGAAFAGGSCRRIKDAGKGHKEEVEKFVECVRTGGPSPISFESIHYTTAVTFRIIDSLQTGLPQKIDGG